MLNKNHPIEMPVKDHLKKWDIANYYNFYYKFLTNWRDSLHDTYHVNH
jgi:hypothetical protein